MLSQINQEEVRNKVLMKIGFSFLIKTFEKLTTR